MTDEAMINRLADYVRKHYGVTKIFRDSLHYATTLRVFFNGNYLQVGGDTIMEAGRNLLDALKKESVIRVSKDSKNAAFDWRFM